MFITYVILSNLIFIGTLTRFALPLAVGSARAGTRRLRVIKIVIPTKPPWGTLPSLIWMWTSFQKQTHLFSAAGA